MGYHVIDPDDVEPMPDRSAEARPVGEAAGLDRRDDVLGVRLYRAGPGEQVPLAYHYHEEQLEAFYVVEGTMHVETPAAEYVVPAGSLFVVEPGNPHRAYNPDDADGRVEVLAVGAPSAGDAVEYEPDGD